MILPTKHTKPDRALLNIGAEILTCIDRPMTASRVWDVFRARREENPDVPAITYDRYILALILLYSVDAVDLEGGVLRKATP